MGPLNASMGTSSEDMVVLIAGSDPIADSICTALAARGADVQQLSAALAVDVIVASAPDAVLLIGDAAKQRGALIRSQLVRRMRGTDVSLVVLVDGPVTLSAGNPVRLVSRGTGAEAIADRLMEVASTAAASRSKGTLDQVATMVTQALERPSQPAPSMQAPAPSRIVMTATPSGAPGPARQSVPARPTIRVSGAIPAPARMPPTPSASVGTAQLSLAPPTSLQAIAARRIEITKANNPPPLPQDTEVSLADVRIETDRISGEINIERAPVPPLPVAKVERANPTPSAWPTEIAEPVVLATRRPKLTSARWAAIVAVAACLGLVAWSALRSSEPAAVVAQPSPDQVGARATPPIAHGQPSTAIVAASDHPKVAHADQDLVVAEDTLLAAQAVGVDGQDGEDPVGDEPHLVRARQLCNEGHALRTRGRLGLAEAKYLQALGLFPQYPRAMAGVVRVHLTRGDGAEAVRWAERLIAMQPNRSNNQLLLGDAYALSGKGHDARRHWRKSAAFGNSTARKRLKDDEPVLAKPTR